MKFTRLILENYIGIYNGMGLNKIDIDLTRCQHRILIIRGENGSGKSTIFNSMTVMPDNNTSFIPGLPASKTIELLQDQNLYRMMFIHPVKADGSRDTTKAYFYKTVLGQTYNLNPNGNVSSYKDILYDELALDPNFIALSQLSTEDRGLASKKPAERKRFVNSIMSSLDVYNDIYKSLLKKSSANRALIQSISSRIAGLGDPEELQTKLDCIEASIKTVEAQKQECLKLLMKCNTHKEILDPDGSIQSRYNTLSAKIAESTKSLYGAYDKLRMNIFDIRSSYEEYREILDKAIKGQQAIEESKDKFYKEYISGKETIADINTQIEQKRHAINSLADDDTFEDISDKLAESEARLRELEVEIHSAGIEPGSFTKAEYITALNTLKDIKEAVLAFRSACTSIDTINEVVLLLQNSDRVQTRDVAQYQSKIDAYLANAPRLNEFIIACDNDIAKLDRLELRPDSCNDDSCPFIADLVRIKNSDIYDRRAKAARDLNELEICYEDALRQIERIKEFNIAANHMNSLIRMITTNGAILTKLPHGSIYTDKYSFISALISNEDFAYVDEIYKFIGIANSFDEYNAEKAVHDDLVKKRDLFLSKSDVIEQLNSEIDKLSGRLASYTARCEELQILIESYTKKLETDKELIKELEKKVSLLASGVEFYQAIMDAKQEMNTLMRQMRDISHYDERIESISKQIETLEKQLVPLNKDRDKIMHSIEVIKDYQRDLEVVQESYNLIEKIRYYSSPTSGIQLVFMELYMGKIIGLANELLSLLFGGKFVIQPFIINDSEFRIPCQGDGIINDDISSMSSAQVSMISMIIGFSLLRNSSTKYNIIKLDEIDGPLDENNRILFIDLLNRIMDIMNTEQCILISHNSELNVADADLIVLKADHISSDYSRGNIVWKY